MKRKSWTAERIELLKRLWGDGNSASEIGRCMGGFDHTPDHGRSAVIGKAHRLGLAARGPRGPDRDHLGFGKFVRRAKKRAAKRKNVPGTDSPIYHFGPTSAPPFGAPEPMPIEDVRPADLVQFNDLEVYHCRFPYGHPREPDFGYCGKPKVVGLSYCEGHARRCFVPPPARGRQFPGEMRPAGGKFEVHGWGSSRKLPVAAGRRKMEDVLE